MLDENPAGELVERAEDLVMRLRDVQSCKIAVDETGRITEVHVVASSDRPPKLIARDVETCLKAEFGLSIDYRKIGVVLIDSPGHRHGPAHRDWAAAPREPEAGVDWIVDEALAERDTEGPGNGHEPGKGEEAVQLEFLEEDMRVRFKGLALSFGESDVNVEVKLERGDLAVVGSMREQRTGDHAYETIASATLHGLMELLDEKFHMCLSGIKEVEISGSRAMIAVIDCVSGRSVRSYSGCVFIGRDPNEAAVLAVLDAINRPFGRWKARREIHYTIR